VIDMRRADRLFQIVQALRRGTLVTARRLADELEVSERTIYRDVRDLVASGVPIEGEAGVGYLLRGFDVPPLMFTQEELTALTLGARVVQSWSDPSLAKAAADAHHKIEAVLPARLRERAAHIPLYAPAFARPTPELFARLAELRRALGEQRKIRMSYRRADGELSRRVVRPLCLAFFPPLWHLAGYCELRREFRNFRLDRISALELGEKFKEEPGQGLEDFLRQVEGKAVPGGDADRNRRS
jgi:predicted DNA-binding transcriptional regulator YafY